MNKAIDTSRQSDQTLSEIATDIYNAKGTFNDNESLTYSSLSRLKSLLELEIMNGFFFNFFHAMQLLNPLNLAVDIAENNTGNVIDYMNSYLNNSEMAKCYAILKALPVFIANGKSYPLPK
jgi:hypothetical protein